MNVSLAAKRNASEDKLSNVRRLDGEPGAFDLDSFITFELLRGGEDSASIDDLGFYLKSVSLKDQLLNFNL